MLRLRAGIGVGAKADLLSFLLGPGGAAADLKTIALATGYADRTMRTAAEEMARARFIHEVEGPPTMYLADPRVLGGVLGISGAGSEPAARPSPPPWRFWSVAFAFLTAGIHWEREADQQGWSSYVASGRARDLVDRQRRRLRHLDLRETGGTDARGAEYLQPFREIMEAVCTGAGRSLVG